MLSDIQSASLRTGWPKWLKQLGRNNLTRHPYVYHMTITLKTSVLSENVPSSGEEDCSKHGKKTLEEDTWKINLSSLNHCAMMIIENSEPPKFKMNHFSK